MPDRPVALDPAWRAVRAASPAVTAGPARARLTFLGHSTVLIEIDDLRILTDPVLRQGFGPVRRQVAAVLPELFADLDAVLISHGHHDHLDQPSLKGIPGEPTVIVPRGFGRMAGKWGLGPVEEVIPGDGLTIDRVRLEIVHAEHSGKREPFGPTGPAIGAVIRGSRSVYFPGDTDLFAGMRDMAGSLDVALLPVWGWGPTIGEGHMDPARAAEAAALLAPRLAVPIHWGTFYPAGLRRVVSRPFDTPGTVFADIASRLAPGVPVRVLAPGESIDIPAGDASSPAARGVADDRR
jgi:L-ascorbate metabolism protein UlaG (beta-lactamase superfamily)